MAKFAQSFCLDLPDSLAGHVEVLSDLFQSVVRLLADAEPHPQHLLLARGQGCQDLAGLFGEVVVDHGFRWVQRTLVFDEVSQVAVFFFAAFLTASFADFFTAFLAIFFAIFLANFF